MNNDLNRGFLLPSISCTISRILIKIYLSDLRLIFKNYLSYFLCFKRLISNNSLYLDVRKIEILLPTEKILTNNDYLRSKKAYLRYEKRYPSEIITREYSVAICLENSFSNQKRTESDLGQDSRISKANFKKWKKRQKIRKKVHKIYSIISKNYFQKGFFPI